MSVCGPVYRYSITPPAAPAVSRLPQHCYFIFLLPFSNSNSRHKGTTYRAATRCTPCPSPPSPCPEHFISPDDVTPGPHTSPVPEYRTALIRRITSYLRTQRIPAAALALHPTEDCLPSECLGHVAPIHHALPLRRTHPPAFAYGRRATIPPFAGTDRLDLVTKHFLYIIHPIQSRLERLTKEHRSKLLPLSLYS